MDDVQLKAQVFKALGDEKRLLILNQLIAGERCACDLLENLGITQPTLSHHMKTLVDSGLVTGRKSGKWMHYQISAPAMSELQNFLGGFL